MRLAAIVAIVPQLIDGTVIYGAIRGAFILVYSGESCTHLPGLNLQQENFNCIIFFPINLKKIYIYIFFIKKPTVVQQMIRKHKNHGILLPHTHRNRFLIALKHIFIGFL